MSIDETPPMVCMSEHDGRFLYCMDDSHAGMLAAWLAGTRGIVAEAGPHQDDEIEDRVLFDRYWRWMRYGRNLFIMSDGGMPRWVVTMKIGMADAMSWDFVKGFRHRTPHYTGRSDGDGYPGGYLRVDFTPDEVDPDTSEWIDRTCNRWTDCICGNELYRHVSDRNSIHDELKHASALAGSASVQDRLLAASSCFVDQATCEQLAEDGSRVVRMALARNREACLPHVMSRLSQDPDWRVRRAVCQNAGVCIDYGGWGYCGRRFDVQWQASIIKGLANDPEYEVRLAAAEVVAHSDQYGHYYGGMVAAVLDSPYDDDFKADVMMEAVAE